MTLLFVLTRFPGYGGIENVTNQVINWLNSTRAKGCNILILSYLKGNKDNELDIPIFYMPQEILGTSKINETYLEQIILEQKVNTIIYQDSYAPTHRQVMSVAKKCKVPVFVFEHNSPLDTISHLTVNNVKNFKDFIRKLTTFHRKSRVVGRKRYLLERCEKYVLLSSRFEEDFKKIVKMPTHEHKILSINNPLNITPANTLPEKKNIVLFVGRLEHVKRLDLCLDFWMEFVKECPDWKFVIVGDGSQRMALENRVRENDIRNVEFKGFDSPLSYYESAKLFWMTSDYEGWGLTLVEAMSQGCVCIARDSFAAVHDIISTENGAVVDKDDFSAFVNKSVEIAQNQPLFSKLAMSAIESSKKFEPEVIMEKWEKLLSIINNE